MWYFAWILGEPICGGFAAASLPLRVLAASPPPLRRESEKEARNY